MLVFIAQMLRYIWSTNTQNYQVTHHCYIYSVSCYREHTYINHLEENKHVTSVGRFLWPVTIWYFHNNIFDYKRLNQAHLVDAQAT